MASVKTLTALAILLLFASVFYRASAQGSLIAGGSGFNTIIFAGDELTFQGDHTFTLEVSSGGINGTNCGLSMYTDQGHFNFYSNNATTLKAYSPDWEFLSISAEGSTSLTGNQSTYYIVSFPASQAVGISWFFGLEDYFAYSMLFIGLGGIILMIFSPTWVAWKVRKSGADVSTVERFGYGMLLFLVGVGLVLTWLWG